MLRKVLKKKELTAVAFISPAMICIFILTLYPIYEVIALSFSKVDLATLSKQFIGFANYREIFTDTVFGQASKNMAIWICVYVPTHFLLGMAAALALNTIIRGRRIITTIIFLPWTISLVTVGLVWIWLLHSDYGWVNSFLRSVGLSSLVRSWLSDPSLSLYTLMFVNSWFSYSFVMLLTLAGLQTIPKSLIEAARIDGATKWQVFIHVIVPWLKVILALSFTLQVVYALQSFTTIWIMTGGGPLYSTELFSTLIYREAFVFLDLPQASAIGVILLIVASVVIIPYVYISTKT